MASSRGGCNKLTLFLFYMAGRAENKKPNSSKPEISVVTKAQLESFIVALKNH